jgi:hypothetical protein
MGEASCKYAVQKGSQVLNVDFVVDMRPVLAGRLPVVDRTVHSGVVDTVGGIGAEKRGFLTVHQTGKVLRTGGVPAKKPVVSEHPKIPGSGDWMQWGLVRSRVIEIDGGGVLIQCCQKLIDLRVRVTHPIKAVLFSEFLKETDKGLLIPLRKFMGSVIGNGISGSLEIRSFEPDHGDLFQSQFLGRLQPGIPSNDLPRGFGHDGLPPPEPPDGGGYVGDGWFVPPGIGGAAVETVNWDPFDLKRCNGHRRVYPSYIVVGIYPTGTVMDSCVSRKQFRLLLGCLSRLNQGAI